MSAATVRSIAASAPPALTRASLAEAVGVLAARDAGLARIVAAHGHPPLWARRSGFTTLVRIILEQQVSLAAAATLFARLEARVPGGLTPATVLALGPAGFRALGVTRQKAGFICALAAHVDDGTLPLAALGRMPDDAATAALQRVPGIGPWSASIYLLMALRRPDVWPPGDLALHKAMARLRRGARVPSTDEAARWATRWAPYRAVAARVLWHAYLSERRTQRARTAAARALR